MKKKSFLICILLFIMSSLFSQNDNFRNYYNSETGYRGFAGSYYLEEMEEEFLEEYLEELFQQGSPVSKLTKKNRWLIKEALMEWDLLPGEFYMVACANNSDSDDGIACLVKTINSNGEYEIISAILIEPGEE